MKAREMFEKLGYKHKEGRLFISCVMDEDNYFVFHKYSEHITIRNYYITIDELQAINQQVKELGWLKDDGQYEETKKLLELSDKSTPKKPIILPNDKNMLHYECPSCKSRIWSNFRGKYCRGCGQKLDWSCKYEC